MGFFSRLKEKLQGGDVDFPEEEQSEDYVELSQEHESQPEAKIVVRPFTIEDFEAKKGNWDKYSSVLFALKLSSSSLFFIFASSDFSSARLIGVSLKTSGLVMLKTSLGFGMLKNACCIFGTPENFCFPCAPEIREDFLVFFHSHQMHWMDN